MPTSSRKEKENAQLNRSRPFAEWRSVSASGETALLPDAMACMAR